MVVRFVVVVVRFVVFGVAVRKAISFFEEAKKQKIDQEGPKFVEPNILTQIRRKMKKTLILLSKGGFEFGRTDF